MAERDNVAAVRRAYEVFASGDREGAMELLDPDVVWFPAVNLMTEQSIYHGREAVCRLVFEEIPSLFDEFSARLLEVHEVGEEQVLAIGRLRCRVPGCSAAVEQTFGQLFTVRDGRAVRMESYPTRRAALEALALLH